MKGVWTFVLAALILSGPLAAHAQQPAATHQHGSSQPPTPPPTPTADIRIPCRRCRRSFAR
jgi:hypothetical protein